MQSIRNNSLNSDEEDDEPSEDDEDSSSSGISEQEKLQESLQKFRETWKCELNERRKQNENPCSHRILVNETNNNVESEARKWFKKGIILEREGKLYDAVAAYRKATLLIPDIEFKYYSTIQNSSLRDEKIAENMSSSRQKRSNDNESKKIERRDGNYHKLIDGSMNDDDELYWPCTPENYQTSQHISCLPYEVILYICKWLVSADLDLFSLEQLSQTCISFYKISRDSELWRNASIKTWGDYEIEKILQNEYSNNWREMFIERPRPNFNGAYISKNTYVRQGETNFQDINYRPCYLVEYYRYLRFFPDGVVLMLNTPEDPYQSLSKLRTRCPRNHIVLKGYYTISGTTISASLRRVSKGNKNSRFKRKPVVSEQGFQITLEIKNIKGRRNTKLIWTDYSVNCKVNNQETTTSFDLAVNKFSPFWFSKVKSYTKESHSIL